MIQTCLPLVKLVLERHILGAVVAVVIGEATALDRHVLAHIDRPGIVRVARKKTT